MISDDEVAKVSSIVEDKMVAAVAVPPALKLKTEPRRYFTMEPPKPDVYVADRMPTIMVAAGYLMVLLYGCLVCLGRRSPSPRRVDARLKLEDILRKWREEIQNRNRLLNLAGRNSK